MNKGLGRFTHFISKIKKVRIWHQRFGHVSNAKIIKASQLVTEMENFNLEYNLTEIYSNSEECGSKYNRRDIVFLDTTP